LREARAAAARLGMVGWSLGGGKEGELEK
jgi:hypothetical protein